MKIIRNGKSSVYFFTYAPYTYISQPVVGERLWMAMMGLDEAHLIAEKTTVVRNYV